MKTKTKYLVKLLVLFILIIAASVIAFNISYNNGYNKAKSEVEITHEPWHISTEPWDNKVIEQLHYNSTDLWVSRAIEPPYFYYLSWHSSHSIYRRVSFFCGSLLTINSTCTLEINDPDMLKRTQVYYYKLTEVDEY